LSQFRDALSGNEQVLANILDRYAITWTLLRPSDGATSTLDHMPGWRRVYTDQFAVIHVRAS
jgi:hypothetical protein